MIHFDTSFVIDLLREMRGKKAGPAHFFMESISEEAIGISLFAACELFMGAELSGKPSREIQRVEALCSNLQLALPDERFAPALAKYYARQERSGQRMATMDLLIATSAILEDATLVTKDVKDFGRVQGLKLLAY